LGADEELERVVSQASVQGPAWTRFGLDQAAGRYPLRVEPHMGRMVERLLPGVITTTYHPRSFALHTLAWAEADKKGLEREEAEAFVRRCEVVLAGIWLAHGDHGRLSRAHGTDEIEKRLNDENVLDIPALAKPGAYAQGKRGFAGIYYASEVELGLLSRGWPPKPSRELDLAPLRDALGPILELAMRDRISLDELVPHGDMCVCQAAEGVDGDLLRQVIVRRVRDGREGKFDGARVATVRLLASLVAEEPEGSLEDAFRRCYGQGPPDATDFSRAAWQGTILRSYSVGAWRRLWSWIVECLSDRQSLAEVGETLAGTLGTSTVGELLGELPEAEADGVFLPAEEELRGDGSPDPRRDLQLLALGASRLKLLETGPTRQAFVGELDEDDLGPVWTTRWLDESRELPTSVFARDLVEMLVHRAERIAMEKMEIRDGRAWVPIRIEERDGLYWAKDREPYNDVTLRVGALGLVLFGLGVFQRDGERWSLTDRGEALVGA
jgi:hypothetical protein